MNFKIQSFLALFFLLFIVACAPPETVKENEQEKTIAGKVISIEFGKDGYTAQIQTKTKDVYSALVSIPNLGGMDNYKKLEMGDFAILRGELWDEAAPFRMKVTKIMEVKSSPSSMMISEKSFEGISPGDLISAHLNILEKDELQNGEGTFDIFSIKNKRYGKVGFILHDPTDHNLVGNIYVQSSEAKTVEGLHIGSTFADILKVDPKVDVHGSEIEGRTYAKIGNLSYRLDANHFTYEVDLQKISKSAKVIEILINR